MRKKKKRITGRHKEVLAQMGITDEVLAHVKDAPTQEEGVRRLTEAQATCKQGFRELAVKLHPDVNDGDDKEYRFVKSCYESFMAASYKGWRKTRQSPLGPDPYARRSNRPDRWDNLYPTDPTLANFWRMKTQAQSHREQTVEDIFRKVRKEQAMRDLFAGIMDQDYSPFVQGPTTHGSYRTSSVKTSPKKKTEQQEFYLADKKGIWRKCLTKSIPNPDIEKLRQRRESR